MHRVIGRKVETFRRGWFGLPSVFLAALFSMPVYAAEGQAGQAPPPASETAARQPRQPSLVNLCEGISCSGKGRCVVAADGPTCACELGYRADPTNGLACLATGAQVAGFEPMPTGVVEQKEYMEQLLNRDVSGYFQDYEEKVGDSPDAEDFATFYYARHRNLRTGMAIMTLAGTAIFWGMGVAGMESANNGLHSNSFGAERAIGVIGCAAGTVTLVVGAVFWARSAKILRKLQPVMRDHVGFRGRNRTSFLGVAPFASAKGDGGGLAASFTF